MKVDGPRPVNSFRSAYAHSLMSYKLFIPGPIAVSEKTLRAMAQPMIGHRSTDFVALYQSIQPDLQALLYTVVLHRYLRWRQPGYDPATHLGGVLYLYLRGMCGPETPVLDGHPAGVFSWQPPAALVTDLSDLLDGRRP